MCMNLAPIEKPLAEIYGRNSFLKVKNDYFPIGKVLFSFVQWTGANPEEASSVEKSIDCCLDICKAVVFAKDLLGGVLADQMPAADNSFVWKSPIGGVKESEAAQRKLRNDGKAIARYFGMQSANKGFCRFTAMQMPGTSMGNGLIVPCKGKPEIVITVPVEDREKLRELGAGILLGIVGYTAGLYASSWEVLKEKRAKYHTKSPGERPNAQNGQEGRKGTESVFFDCYWSVEKGSVMETSGTKSGQRMLRLVVPRISQEDKPLATDDKWQLADVLFPDQAVKTAPRDLREQIQRLIGQAEAGLSAGSIKQLPLQIGAIRNGYRQIYFAGK